MLLPRLWENVNLHHFFPRFRGEANPQCFLPLLAGASVPSPLPSPACRSKRALTITFPRLRGKARMGAARSASL